MSTLHMTDVVVSRLQQPGTYWDETTPGFGVRVGKNRKTWIVMRGQIRQRVRIGHYPRMSLADARKEAKKLLLEEPKHKVAITFKTAYDGYKADVIDHKKPKTQVEYKRLLTKYFTPKIGRKRLAELTYDEIIECV
ncbi:MAG TPA: Arm DNA-binding domain-containing protein, partial [Xanthobacteraceae bacterium]